MEDKCSVLARLIYKAFSNQSIKDMKKAIDESINAIMLEEDKKYVDMAILAYVLYKIMTKRKYIENYKEYIEAIKKELKDFCEHLNFENIEKIIVEMEQKDVRYVFDMFTKARVKVGAILYAKGFSLGKAAVMVDVPKQEILSYAGKTMMFDRVKDEMGVKKRLKMAEKIFFGD